MKSEIKREFAEIPLLAHRLLKGVPIHSLDLIELKGGRPGMTMLEVKEAAGFNTGKIEAGPITTALFWLRGFIGRIFRWDNDEELANSVSYIDRLTAEERERSKVRPGTPEGISRVLYCSDNEFLAEIVNRTVHCFWLLAIREAADGYKLYSAVYVKTLNWFTPVYMTLVGPMLKWIIYPALYKSVRDHWQQTWTANGQTDLKARSVAHQGGS